MGLPIDPGRPARLMLACACLGMGLAHPLHAQVFATSPGGRAGQEERLEERIRLLEETVERLSGRVEALKTPRPAETAARATPEGGSGDRTGSVLGGSAAP